MSAIGDTLQLFTASHEARLEEQADVYKLSFSRNGIDVVITVPKRVREWFIDAHENVADQSTSEWLDYAGYDDTSETQLTVDMNADIKRIVGNLLERPLRFVSNRGMLRTKAILQWQTGGNWEQALPLVLPAHGIVDEADGRP